MIVKLYFLIIYIIEGMIYSQYCSSIFKSNRSRLFENIFITVLYGILFIISFLDTPLLNIIAFLSANFLFVFVVYQTTWQLALFHAVISTAVMCLSELVVLANLPGQVSSSYTEWQEVRTLIIPAVLSKSAYFIILHLWEHFSRVRKEGYTHNQRPIILLTTVSFISIFTTFTLLQLCTYGELSLWLTQLISFSTLFLLALNVIIWEFYSYTMEKNAKMLDLQLSLQKESDIVTYYKVLIEQAENQSHFIHDTKKHFQSIALLNEKGEKEKISAYIDSLISSSAMRASARICTNDFLNALLVRYVMQCNHLNISFKTDIRSGGCEFLKESDMTSLFCNLLDNAVEAAEQMPNSFIELSIDEKEGTSFTLITLINSCRRNPFSASGTIPRTTKPDTMHHGYGMKIIERIVKNYKGEIQTYYSDETLTFHTIITLRK